MERGFLHPRQTGLRKKPPTAVAMTASAVREALKTPTFGMPSLRDGQDGEGARIGVAHATHSLILGTRPIGDFQLRGVRAEACLLGSLPASEGRGRAGPECSSTRRRIQDPMTLVRDEVRDDEDSRAGTERPSKWGSGDRPLEMTRVSVTEVPWETASSTNGPVLQRQTSAQRSRTLPGPQEAPSRRASEAPVRRRRLLGTPAEPRPDTDEVAPVQERMDDIGFAIRTTHGSVGTP